MNTIRDRRNAAAGVQETIDIDAHSRALMDGLEQLRHTDHLLDVTFIVEGVRIKAHRVVLAACSDYFRAMFSMPMKESRETEIELNDLVTADAVSALLDYTYTSKLNLTCDNIDDILSAANYFQMNTVVLACSAYLESQINLDNCLDIVELADFYELRNLKTCAYYFMCVNFKELTNTKHFYNLRYDQMEYMLSNKFPTACSELQLAINLAEYCMENKLTMDASRHLFSMINFNEINMDLFRIPVSTKNDQLCKQLYLNVVYAVSHEQRAGNKIQPNCEPSTNLRGMVPALLKIGGFNEDGLHNRISFAFPDEKKWYPLTEIPHVEQSNYGVAVSENNLFIVGGSYDVCLKEYIHGFGFQYNVVHNNWTSIEPLRWDRCRFSMIVRDQFLMTIGGVYEPGEDDYDFSNFEMYNVRESTWSYMPALRENRSQHAAVIKDHMVYVSGGIDREIVLSTFYVFDTVARAQWVRRRNMLTPRADHALVAIGNLVYACGGWYEDLQTGTRVLVETIDAYNVATDTWTIETTNPVPAFHAGITAIDSKIYFVGGLLSDDTTHISSEVQVYDVKSKEWSTETQWENSEPTWECSCVMMYVPTCRRDIFAKQVH